ncbi:cinnamoyl-CoA reductase 1-like [Punica granatum]|uniref:Cinnamoyl-CoA reductase 1-like n=1 Tax=Punica granatum TaxID=22663 RepID=A0A6P8E743_PUNGR|nr:cinnamoyl-CoA reductase 1-like [Punica granatum]
MSPTAAVGTNPNWPKDETCWSDKEYCRTNEESTAFEYGKQNGLDVIAVNPGFVFGPVMQPILNFSPVLLVKFVKGIYIQIEQGARDSVPNKFWNVVDVRDVAKADTFVLQRTS